MLRKHAEYQAGQARRDGESVLIIINQYKIGSDHPRRPSFPYLPFWSSAAVKDLVLYNCIFPAESVGARSVEDE